MARALTRIEPVDQSLGELGFHLQEFQATLDALQEFLDIIAPQIKALDQNRNIPDLLGKMIGQLSGESHTQALRDIETLASALGDALRQVDAQSDATSETSTGPIPMTEHGARIIMAAAQAAIAKPKLPILLRSMIPMAVGALEVLVGQLLTAFYHIRPGLLPKEEKEFSLADLEQFGSVKDAFDDAVQRRIDNILAGGFDEWAKWFGRRGIEINISQLALDWPGTLEIFQRRHIIIHNAGRVSKRYLSKLTDYRQDLPGLGTEVTTDVNYVQSVLDNLNVLGFLLTAVVQKKLTTGKTNLGMDSRLSRRIDDLIKLQRWEAAQKLAQVSKSFKEFPEASRITFQCEEWLCSKELDGIDSIRSEVEGWDTSALGHQFKAMRYKLLDMQDEAATSLTNALASNEIGGLQVSLSPILRAIQDSSSEPNNDKHEHGAPQPNREEE